MYPSAKELHSLFYQTLNQSISTFNSLTPIKELMYQIFETAKLYFSEASNELEYFYYVLKDSSVSIISAVLSYIKGLSWLTEHVIYSIINTMAYSVNYVANNFSEYAIAAAWYGERTIINRIAKAKQEVPYWLRRALMLQVGTALTTWITTFPAVFPLQGKLEFMRTGTWNPFIQWNYSGYTPFEIITIAKKWKCYPVKIAYERLKKKIKKEATEAIKQRVGKSNKLLKATVYGRYKGIKNLAYNAGYFLSELLLDEDIRKYKPGKEPAPPKGLILSSYGYNVITYPTPPVRALTELQLYNSKLFKFYKDELGRIWAKFDAFGTFGGMYNTEIENLPNVLVLKKRTWIEEGVKSVIELSICDDRYVPLRVKVRFRRLLTDLLRLLYPVVWTKNLREHGIKAPQVPASQAHIDCIERHVRYIDRI